MRQSVSKPTSKAKALKTSSIVGLIFRTEYKEECSTSYEQECSTSYETTYEQQCSTSYETVCEEAQSSYGGSSGGYGAPSAPKCTQQPKQNCQQVN